MASANENTIVVVNTVGQIDMEQWVDHPNVTAIVCHDLAVDCLSNTLLSFGLVYPVRKPVNKPVNSMRHWD